MMFEIEKGIPLPESNKARGRELKYPFRKMLVGDSFVVPVSTRLEYQKLSSAASQAGIRSGMKFATRRVDGGVRVFRIE